MSDYSYLSDEEVLEMLQRCDEKYGTCKPRLFDGDSEFCSIGEIIDRFGAWRHGMQLARVQTDKSE